MSYLERQPYAKDLGVMSVFARRAPMFLMAAVLFTVLAAVFTLQLVRSEREEMGNGTAGAPMTISAAPQGGVGKATPIVAASGTTVSAADAACTMVSPGGDEKDIRIGLASETPFTHAGELWSPIAEVYPVEAGSTITCTGPGVDRLVVTYDTKRHWWPLVIAACLGAPLAWVTTGIAYALRRSARR